VCFVEHADHVTGAVTQEFQKAAWEWFHVSADKVYVWQYNGRTLNSEHFVYLLNDIGKALVCVIVLLLSFSICLSVTYSYQVVFVCTSDLRVSVLVRCFILIVLLQCFDAVGWLTGRAPG